MISIDFEYTSRGSGNMSSIFGRLSLLSRTTALDETAVKTLHLAAS